MSTTSTNPPTFLLTTSTTTSLLTLPSFSLTPLPSLPPSPYTLTYSNLHITLTLGTSKVSSKLSYILNGKLFTQPLYIDGKPLGLLGNEFGIFIYSTTSLYAYSFTSRLTTLSSGPFYLGIKNITLLKKYLCLEGGDGSLTFYSYTRFWEDVSTVKNNNADAGHSVYIPTHELYKPPVPFQKGLAIIKDSPDMMRVIRRVSNDILTECYVNDCWKVIETRECKGEEEDCIPTKVGFKDGRGCNIIDNENLGPGTAQLIKDISTLNNPQSGLINKDYIIVTNENGVCLWEEKVVGGGGKWRKVKLFEGEGCKIVGGRGRVEGVEFKR